MSGPLYRHRSSGSLWRAVWRNAGPDGGSICMRSYPDNGRIEVVPANALERDGEFMPTDERLLQEPLSGDHGVIVVGPTCRSISCWLTQYERRGRRAFLTTSIENARRRVGQGEAVLSIVWGGDSPTAGLEPIPGINVPQILVHDEVDPRLAANAVAAGFLYVIGADDGSRLSAAVDRVMHHHDLGPAQVVVVERDGHAGDRARAALESHGLVVRLVSRLEALFTCGGLVAGDAVIIDDPAEVADRERLLAALRASPEWTDVPILVRAGPDRLPRFLSSDVDLVPSYPAIAARVKARVASARGLPRWFPTRRPAASDSRPPPP